MMRKAKASLLLLAIAGFNPAPGSPVIDAGTLTELHCPTPVLDGGNMDLARASNPDCIPWKGSAPDIGACEFDPLGGNPGFPCNQGPWYRPSQSISPLTPNGLQLKSL